MPRVGSSRIRTFGSVVQPFADDDLLLVAAGEVQDLLLRAGRLDVELLDVGLGDLVFLLAARGCRPSSLRADTAAWYFPGQTYQGSGPRSFRSSGTRPSPARMASVGVCFSQLFAVDDDTRRCPAGRRRRSPRMTSLRPAPISPAKPRISPRWSVEADVLHHLARVQMLCLEHGFADLRRCPSGRYRRACGRPSC